MPSDYRKICRDNLHRRGEEFDDIGRLISEQLYSDKSHFVYELLQNAEDALERRFRKNHNADSPRAVRFRLFPNRLEFRHFGAPFDQDDVRGISDVLKGTKAGDFEQIGKFGIGFKSVYAFTASPEIHSGDEHFVVKRYIRPEKREPSPDLLIEPNETIFVFPFDHEDVPADRAFDLISRKLRGLGPRVLLFLRRIDEIEWSVEPDGEKGQYLKETKQSQPVISARHITVIGQKNGRDENESWLIFERPVSVPDNSGKVPVEVGFRLETRGKDKTESFVRENNTRLFVYFPTEKDTRLGFLIQGPYRTTPARDNIRGNDDWNKKLIEETAELVVEAVRQLKDMGLLSISFLEALPIRFEDKYGDFCPIFSRVRSALMKEELLPTEDGTFVAARNAKLVRGAALMEILNQEQLGALFQSNDEIKWLSADITQDNTPVLRSYLTQALDVEEVTPEVFAGKLSDQFLVNQDDEWFIKFYEFLSERKALWRTPGWKGDTGILQNKPILRLQEGTHVNPFRHDGSPNAYLAVGEDTDTSLPIVKVALSSHNEVRQFLVQLGIEELDLVAEVVEKILPKYMDESAAVESEENKHHLMKIEQAYKTDSQAKKSRLRETLLKTRFILAQRAAVERTVCRKPDQVYFDSQELRMYFCGNNSFACVNLDHPQSALFKDLGVKETVRVHRKEKNSQGYVCIKSSHSHHERGHKGFDPDIRVDGLECAITAIEENPLPPSKDNQEINNEIQEFNNDARELKQKMLKQGTSKFIWNEIACPNSDCIRGVVEKSTRQTYQGSKREVRLSAKFGKLLIETAWLPDANGNLHKPSDLTLDDLDESFVRDEKLADQLGMKKNVVTTLAEEAGISKTALDRARQIEAASPEVQQQIDSLLQKQEMSQENRDSGPYHEALSDAFSAPGRGISSNGGENGGLSQDPSRRRRKTQEDIATAIENEGKPGGKFSFTIRKKWKSKNDQVSVAFAEWYGGRCQICDKTFTQVNGEPYFEGVYLVSRTTAGWRDREGNVLCLCAQHSAMFQFGPKEADEGIVQQVMQLKLKAEGGDGRTTIRMKLCGDPIAIRYAEKHLIDLQEMVRATKGEGH